MTVAFLRAFEYPPMDREHTAQERWPARRHRSEGLPARQVHKSLMQINTHPDDEYRVQRLTFVINSTHCSVSARTRFTIRTRTTYLPASPVVGKAAASSPNACGCSHTNTQDHPLHFPGARTKVWCATQWCTLVFQTAMSACPSSSFQKATRPCHSYPSC